MTQPNSLRFRHARQSGFSMLEVMLVVAILTLVLGVVVNGAIKLQRRKTVDTSKVDLTQQTRQFMDQVVKDLHHAGYPSIKMLDPGVAAANPALYARGLVNVDSNSIVFEGDVDGSGKVSIVTVRLNPPNGPCPCILERGSVYKEDFLATGKGPDYYTQVDNVMNLNMNINTFTALLNDGNAAELPCVAPGGCADGNGMENIKAVGLTLNVRTTALSSEDKAFSTITMSSEAKINN